MTALRGLDRLEAEGLFAPAPDAPTEPVLLQFGDAALTILRFDETPIDQWPLATLRRVAAEDDGAPGLMLAPDHAAPERLRIADRDMIAAIGQVARGIDAPPPRPRRPRRRALRAAALAGGAAALAFGLWAAGPALLGAVGAAAPEAARTALGDAALLRAADGRLCADPAALAALARWSAALEAARGGPVRLAVAAPGVRVSGLAPGGRALLAAEALDEDAALVAARLSAALRAAEPLMSEALRASGLAGLVELLSGAPDGPALAAAAARLRPLPDLLSGAASSAAPGAVPNPGAAPSPADYAAIRAGCAS